MNQTFPSSAPDHTRRWYAYLACGYALFAVYGSLVPFHYHFLSWDAALDHWRRVQLFPLKIESRSDFVANVLLFVPLGFLCMGALSVDRPALRSFVAGLIVIPCCAALSAAIEFTQIYFPPRVSSGSDIVGESLGAAVGVMLWLLAGRRTTHWLRQIGASPSGRSRAVLLIPAYLAFLVLISVMPLDLTLSPAEIYRKYRRGMIVLVPFSRMESDLLATVGKALWNAACFFPLGMLLAFVPATSSENKRNWLRVWLLGLVAAAVIEFLQVFVRSRFSEATDVITGGLGVVAGWTTVRIWQNLHKTPSPAARFLLGTGGWTFAFILWLAVTAVTNWRPFDFNLDPDYLAGRWRSLSLIPFADYQAGTPGSAVDQFLQKTMLFFPLGALLGCVPLLRKTKRSWLPVLALGMMIAAIIEAGQLALPTRYASLSDVLVEAFGTAIGFLTIRRIQFSGGEAPRFSIGTSGQHGT